MSISYDRIERHYKWLKRIVSQIDRSDNKNSREKIHDQLISENLPAISYARKILEKCTQDSIESNYDNLIRFFHDNCELSNELSERIINEVYKNFPLEEDHFCRYKHTIFSSKWSSNHEEMFRKCDWKVPNDKSGLYCVYFSSECTLDEVVWYLEHRCRRILSRRTMKSDRVSTKALADRCLVGWLTLRKVKPKDIEQIFLKLHGGENLDKVPYIDTVYRNRSRLKKQDWFKEARTELDDIFRKNKKLRDLAMKYDEQLRILYAERNSFDKRKEFFTKNEKPRFLDLSFDDKKTPLFHVVCVRRN